MKAASKAIYSLEALCIPEGRKTRGPSKLAPIHKQSDLSRERSTERLDPQRAANGAALGQPQQPTRALASPEGAT